MRSFVLVFTFIFKYIRAAELEKTLNAELLVLPPLVLGYEDLAYDDTPSNPQQAAIDKAGRQFADKLSKYTLKFEGNFAVPNELKADLLKLQLDETRKSAVANGLGNLLLQKANVIIPTPSMNTRERFRRRVHSGNDERFEE